jgi:hypothetical protein
MEASENQVVNNPEETPDRQAWHAPRLVELAVRDTESGTDPSNAEDLAPLYAPS